VKSELPLAVLSLPRDEPEPDGRRRRSQDSRARIIAAMLELVHSGKIAPGAEQVAARAGVGLRTVFRHFKDMDSVYREMATVIEGELGEVLKQPLAGETWRERLSDLIVRRSLAFEKIAPFKRAANAHRHASPFLEAHHARLTCASRDILRELLPAAIAAEDLKLETLDLLLGYETWSRLRGEQGLSIRRAREIITFAVERIVGEAR
jgi:AcrR family transcriptional regulator